MNWNTAIVAPKIRYSRNLFWESGTAGTYFGNRLLQNRGADIELVVLETNKELVTWDADIELVALDANTELVALDADIELVALDSDIDLVVLDANIELVAQRMRCCNAAERPLLNSSKCTLHIGVCTGQ